MELLVINKCESLQEILKLFVVFRIHLFENNPYSEEEKQECLNEAQQLREEVGGLYTEFILPSIPLAKKIESLSWIAVGESLLATYRSMSESSDPLVRKVIFSFRNQTNLINFIFSFIENELFCTT